jgi:dTDP-4-dehydrorhamnose reductase
MILLLGATGYVGQAFAEELRRRGVSFHALSRKDVDYTRFETFFPWLQKNRPTFVINAAGYTGKPNVDACEEHKADTLLGNVNFPQMMAQCCATLDIPYGQVSSGCIYAGGKVKEGNGWRIERDLNQEKYRQLALEKPDHLKGFVEDDIPNFTFRQPPCSFYSGTKALGEEVLHGVGNGYLWRLRIPFDHRDNPRNYLSKVQNYSKVYDNLNSISHLNDFVSACLDLIERKAPWGTYNVVNPGYVSTRWVVEQIQEILKPNRSFEFWESDEVFYAQAAKTPRSNCLMEPAALESVGIQLRPVEEAVRSALQNWVKLS